MENVHLVTSVVRFFQHGRAPPHFIKLPTYLHQWTGHADPAAWSQRSLALV
jgi:hypothetical protein